MTADEKREEAGFKVTDRRLFTSDGSVRDKAGIDESPAPDTKPGAAPIKDKKEEHRESAGKDASAGKEQAGAMDFGSFLLSLATTTLVHLGDVPDPSGGKPTPNLAAAKQMVDILAMLQQKSEGNRTADETRLLDDVLYELRMRILAKNKNLSL